MISFFIIIQTELTATDDMVDELYSDEQLSRYPLECMNFSNAVTVSSVGDENSDLSGNTTTINVSRDISLIFTLQKLPMEVQLVKHSPLADRLVWLSDSVKCFILQNPDPAGMLLLVLFPRE